MDPAAHPLTHDHKEEIMEIEESFIRNTAGIERLCLFLSLSLLIACPIGAWYTGTGNEIFSGWFTILTSPCPLVTDYFLLGSLPAAFLNAGACGLACCLLMYGLKAECHANTLAGFLLVIGHCFYGLNLLNMWPPILGILLFCRVKKYSFTANLSMAMFSTAFGPFVSELLFRYPLGGSFVFGEVHVDKIGIVFTVLFAVILGFAIPAMLPGAARMHKGYNLYNGGLAFGLLGLLFYSFMYKTFGIDPPVSSTSGLGAFGADRSSWLLFANAYFLTVFGICLIAGWRENGKSLRGYGKLLKESGHHCDFLEEFGISHVLINLGFYGFTMLLYFDLVILFTEGAGATAATVGSVLVAMTFAASGQHPRNVWPIFAGYVLLSFLVCSICLLIGRAIPWTLSTQGYLNGAACATGLAPVAGKYGKGCGILAGFLCAIICTSTSALHGGFVLYNGGLSAGLTALILIPCLEYYYHERRPSGS